MDMRFVKTSPEKVVGTCQITLLFNFERFMETGKRVVDLACGHKLLTRSRKKTAVCPRCTEMLKRSIKDGGEDYESFRNGVMRDTMEWSQDPCRILNER